MDYCSRSSVVKVLTFTCGRDNLKSYSVILPKFVMHVTNDQFSVKFNNGWKKNQNEKKIEITDLMWFFAFYVNNLTLWAR